MALTSGVGVLATEELRQTELLDRISESSWQTLEVFSAQVALTAAATTSGSIIDIHRSSSQTISVDLTGNNSAAPTLIWYGRIGSNPWFILRRETSTCNTALNFKLGTAGNTTGITAGMTGVTRVDQIFFQIHFLGTGTGATNPTIRVKAALSPVF